SGRRQITDLLAAGAAHGRTVAQDAVGEQAHMHARDMQARGEKTAKNGVLVGCCVKMHGLGVEPRREGLDVCRRHCNRPQFHDVADLEILEGVHVGRAEISRQVTSVTCITLRSVTKLSYRLPS